MKGKASFDPVTRATSAEYEYSADDHRETRKDYLFGGVIVLAIIGVVAYLVWQAINRAGETGIGKALATINPGQWVEATTQTAKTAITAGAVKYTPPPDHAYNATGDPYPVKTLTSEDYDQMLRDAGLLAIPVQVGNLITPPFVLEAAAEAGAQSADTVNRLGLNDAYVGLNGIQKSLVTLGEGAGQLVGVDLIQMGYNLRQDIAAANAAGQPSGATDRALTWTW